MYYNQEKMNQKEIQQKAFECCKAAGQRAMNVLVIK